MNVIEPSAALLLRTARKIKGMSQIETALLYGCACNTLQRWESGETEPRYSQLVLILNSVFGVTIAQISNIIKNEQLINQ